MRIIQPSVELIGPPSKEEIYRQLETAGRTCYKSGTDNPPLKETENFVRRLIANGHEAMIEHFSITAKFICDRGVSHEIVRHRVASYAQESTRYCNYSQKKFDHQITVIEPCFWEPTSREYMLWHQLCVAAESTYFQLIELGATPQEARSVLPTSLKTEIVVTMNPREWRHFFKLRAIGTTGAPHPQMQQVALMALEMFTENWPALFDDIHP